MSKVTLEWVVFVQRLGCNQIKLSGKKILDASTPVISMLCPGDILLYCESPACLYALDDMGKPIQLLGEEDILVEPHRVVLSDTPELCNLMNVCSLIRSIISAMDVYYIEQKMKLLLQWEKSLKINVLSQALWCDRECLLSIAAEQFQKIMDEPMKESVHFEMMMSAPRPVVNMEDYLDQASNIEL